MTNPDTIAVIVGEMRSFSPYEDVYGDRVLAWADRLAALGDLEKDAARYRWLNQNFQAKYHRATCDYWVISGEYKTDEKFFGENDVQLTLTSAIDAAMQPKDQNDD